MPKFNKKEHLCSHNAFAALFEGGSAVDSFPIKVIWRKLPTGNRFPALMAVVVPKKKFKRAHDRNLLKRRIREAYRLKKEPFYEILRQSDITVNCIFIYTARKEFDYAEIEKAVEKALEKLAFSATKKKVNVEKKIKE